jgi:hypothetical protein
MSKFNPVGKRADKYRLRSPSATEGGEDDDSDFTRIEGGAGDVTKEIEYYTISCSECNEDGRYDEKREVICPSCGAVLSGDRPSLMFDEFANGADGEEREDAGVSGPLFPG